VNGGADGGRGAVVDAVDENVGAAGVFEPADRGLPADGVVALGGLDAPGWLVADLDLEALEHVRRDGQVLGHRDWDRADHLAGEVAHAALAGGRVGGR
jgi:predicted amidohydrolase